MLARTWRLGLGCGLLLALGCGKSDGASPDGAAGQGTAGAPGSSGAGIGSTAGAGGSASGAAPGATAEGGLTTGGTGEAGASSEAFAGSGNEGGAGSLVDCDPRKISCKRAAPECGAMEVPSVEGTCYGECVKIDHCACAGPEACPNENEYTCWSRTHCGPYIR